MKWQKAWNRPSPSRRGIPLFAIAGMLLLGCSGGSSGPGAPTAPSSPPEPPGVGTLEIALTRVPGTSLRLFHALVKVTGPSPFEEGMQENRIVTRTDITAGAYEVRLEDLTTDCAVEGPPGRNPTVSSGGVARVEFLVACIFVPEERIVYNGLGPLGNDTDVSSARPDGSEVRRLTQLNDLAFPAWSPDGTRVLAGWQEIWIMNHDGTEATRVSRGRSPKWSPDGRRIAYALNGDLAVADLDGRSLTNVMFLTGDGGSIDDGAPNWSPDGSTIAFQRNGVIHLINADGSGLRVLVPGAQAVWMPDGSRIVFVDTGLGQIASMKLDGTDVRVLTGHVGGAGHPDPSPDGEEFVFHSPRLSAQARLWIMNADGSNPRVIEAIPTGAEHANWGPP